MTGAKRTRGKADDGDRPRPLEHIRNLVCLSRRHVVGCIVVIKCIANLVRMLLSVARRVAGLDYEAKEGG